jgi:hypothetical protein
LGVEKTAACVRSLTAEESKQVRAENMWGWKDPAPPLEEEADEGDADADADMDGDVAAAGAGSGAGVSVSVSA